MTRSDLSAFFLICSLWTFSFGQALEQHHDGIELWPITHQYEAVPTVGSEDQSMEEELRHDLDELASVMKILQLKITDILTRWDVQKTDPALTQSPNNDADYEAVYSEYNLY
ncbi:hypothetical protein TCAL_16146 [Tigriopus californicus]|uniref:Uncharacterized protein n=1 Tax=Tigriopus californicus TaxID=6832 RepID=A0A553P1V3_TIGCA|nr:uncharacterized protein LOC131883095 [Tigriopus californicus]TRY71671.1 hypothetical protein TCAL_16146 [Tigriopus californicus]